MGVSLGDLHYTLGVDESQLDAQLAKAKAKITAALVDPSITKANLALASQSAGITAKNALTTERLAKADLSAAKAADVRARSQAALNITNLQAVGINQRNTAAQQTLGNAQAISNNAALTSAQRLIIAQNQAAASHSRVTTAANAASRSQQTLANHSGITSRAFITQRGIAMQLASTLGGAFTIVGITAFIKQMAEVRGEFELQQVALRAITRDKEAADKIFSQVKTLSVVSPFTFAELLRDTKQLAAFSVETDKLYGTLTRLADVSAGLGVDMNRIILAYGQVKAATVLRGQELRQFTEAGIPIIDMLATKFTKLEGTVVSAGDVFSRISKKMVSFKDVDEIFTQLTSSGGMFFEMQKKQSETLAGKLANLKDAYMIMLNGIGEGNDVIMKGGADALFKLMSNWKDIADTLKTVIAVYGAFKVATMVSVAWNKLNAASYVLLAQNSTLLSIAQARAAVVTNSLTAAQTGLNTAMKANWIGAAVAALVGLGVVLYNVYQNAHELENALNKIKDEEKGSADAQIIHLELLTDRLRDANMMSIQRKQIITELNNIASPYLKNLLTESMTYDEITKALSGVNDAIYENAKAKAYQNASTKITDELSKGVTSATQDIKQALSNIGVKGELSSLIIGKMFGDIKNNPELLKNSDALAKYIESTIAGITKGKSKMAEFSMDKSSFTVSTIISGLQDFSSATEGAKKGIDDVSESISIWGKVNETSYATIEGIRKATIDSVDAVKNSANSNQKDIEIRDIKIKGLLDEAAAWRILGMEDKASKAEGDAKSLNPLIDSLGRLKQQVQGLGAFKVSGLSIDTVFPENKDIEKVSGDIISEVKKTEEAYKLMAETKKGIYKRN